MIKKIGVLGGALAAGAIAAAVAVPATASHQAPGSTAGISLASMTKSAPSPLNQPAQYTASVPSYGATGADFEQATITTTLGKDVGQFSSSYQPFISVYNSTTSPEVELIPTTNSPAQSDSWNPNADIGGVSAQKSFWVQPTPYPASSACHGNVDARGCFYAGETVTLTVSYNTGSDTAYMTVADKANGDEYSALYQYTSAQQLTSVHLGDVWLQTFDGGGFVPSAKLKQLGSFSAATLTNTSGRTKPLGSWEHYQRIMTSDGTSKGQVDSEPGPLSNDGRDFSLYVR